MQDSESPTQCCPDLKTKFDDWKVAAERSVREEPIKTAGLAFVAGIFLTGLPVGRIVAGLVRLGLALVRPALLILGVVKVIETIDQQKKS